MRAGAPTPDGATAALAAPHANQGLPGCTILQRAGTGAVLGNDHKRPVPADLRVEGLGLEVCRRLAVLVVVAGHLGLDRDLGMTLAPPAASMSWPTGFNGPPSSLKENDDGQVQFVFTTSTFLRRQGNRVLHNEPGRRADDN
jgi:hypothetical protein